MSRHYANIGQLLSAAAAHGATDAHFAWLAEHPEDAQRVVEAILSVVADGKAREAEVQRLRIHAMNKPIEALFVAEDDGATYQLPNVEHTITILREGEVARISTLLFYDEAMLLDLGLATSDVDLIKQLLEQIGLALGERNS